jgi:hypothetical protein
MRTLLLEGLEDPDRTRFAEPTLISRDLLDGARRIVEHDRQS